MPSSSEEPSSSEIPSSSDEPSSSEEPSSSDEPSSESSSESSSSAPVYDEAPDSLDGVDPDDMSGLYNAFASPITNYTSDVSGYFNRTALYDYYRHYQKNYVQESTNLFIQEGMYRYPTSSAYLSVLNAGYVDYQNNAYSFSLAGDTVVERLSSSVSESDLALVSQNDSYRNHLFTLEDLSESYFASYGFTRISKNKYQYARSFVSDQDNAVFGAFIDLCAPGLINTGMYMTFSRVTIELNPSEDVDFRIRLYAYSTQSSKLDENHANKDYANWYLLFSEANISSVDATEIVPLSNLLS